MSDADAPGYRSDPRVIRRLNVIIALLLVPYALFVLDRFGGLLLWLGIAAFAVVAVAFPVYVFWPYALRSVLRRGS